MLLSRAEVAHEVRKVIIAQVDVRPQERVQAPEVSILLPLRRDCDERLVLTALRDECDRRLNDAA